MIKLMIIALLIATILIEVLIYHRFLWRFRLALVVLLTLGISSISAILLQEYPTWIGVTVMLCSLFRLLNMFRIAQARMHENYLKSATKRTSLRLGVLQLVFIFLLSPYIPGDIALSYLPFLIATVQFIAALVLLYITLLNISQTRYRQGKKYYADKELPTVSLLIPARNETTDLESCLRSALASDYPKLEIIVLDDCSQVKTSEIIKGFAHKGVRFVQGSEPNERWLAKNHAYEKLAKEASGELLLFCGVDVRFGTSAIKSLVTELINRDKQMVSVLPHRLSSSIAGAFIQPMRYWWELSLPRKFFNRPPVLSTCWIIRAKTLNKLGGFAANSRSVIPEGYFARELITSNDYSFIRANDTLDIQTRKSYKEQRATAVRTRYPQLRRRPENVLVLVLLEFIFLLGPFMTALFGFWINDTSIVILASLASLLLILNHIIIVQLTSPTNTVIALINFPAEVLTEIVITVSSMLKYEFGNVEWKDRNVCIPVMHVIPKLPDLPKN